MCRPLAGPAWLRKTGDYSGLATLPVRWRQAYHAVFGRLETRPWAKWIPLTTHDGPVRAWMARPDTAPRGGVVVIQEIFGVNPHIRAVTDRFAEVRVSGNYPTCTQG